jgi:hypothetical protein
VGILLAVVNLARLRLYRRELVRAMQRVGRLGRYTVTVPLRARPPISESDLWLERWGWISLRQTPP